MTLRLRLLLAIGLSFTLFWSLASVWMLVDLRSEFRAALDERLAASARMVAALVAEAPQMAAPAPSLRSLPYLVRNEGVACEIRMLRGEVVGRTANSPQQLGAVPPGLHTRVIDGVAWRSFTLDQNGVRVTTADRIEQRLQLFHDIAWATMVPSLIALAASMAALWIAVRRGLRPLADIREALAARDPDALQPLPERGQPGELAPLVATINSLFDRIARAIERERRFTGEAAHELRTPLTAIKTHLQVARLAPGRDQMLATLDQAGEGVRRLQGTLEQLLMLARLEGPFSFDEDERSDARAVAAGALEQIPGELIGRITVCDEGGAAAPVLVPPALAVNVLRNLLDNALRHGAGAVKVLLRRAGGEVVFVVEDDGPGMSAAEIASAAQRFWRKGEGHGSGLGLAIVDAIVTRYGGTWALAARPGGGLSVQVRLPSE